MSRVDFQEFYPRGSQDVAVLSRKTPRRMSSYCFGNGLTGKPNAICCCRMRLMTFRYAGQDHAGVLTPEGIAPVLEINARYDLRIPNSLLQIIKDDIREIPTAKVRPIRLEEIEPRLPYEVPPKIWCIGLNYKSHAEDIAAVQPEEPGSFMKPASCMFQPGGDIFLPPPEVSDDVDAEGELGLVIAGAAAGSCPSIKHVKSFTDTPRLST